MIDPEIDYGNLSPLLKHKEAQINLSYIENNWEEMAQFYASIEQGNVTAVYGQLEIPFRSIKIT